MTAVQKELKKELNRLNSKLLNVHADRHGFIWVTPVAQPSPNSFKLPDWAVCENQELGMNETRFHHIYLRGADKRTGLICTVISQNR